MKTAISRVFALVICLAASMASQGQERSLNWKGKDYSLGPALAVASEVDQALWSGDGSDLAYVIRVDGWTQIGLFSLKHRAGAIVANLSPAERLEDIIWLNGSHQAVLVTRRKVEGNEVPTEALYVKVADTADMKARELWAKEFPVSANASIVTKTSPTIPHALITVRTTQENLYLVLTQQARSIVLSQDLADADKAGDEMVGWSVDGTALFGISTASGEIPDLTDLPIIGALFAAYSAISPQSQPKIEDALECMPSNGVLRPIHFPGFYEPAAAEPFPLKIRMQPGELHFGESTAAIQSLWLVPTAQAKEASMGLLVSAEAEAGWLSPTGKAIAYTSHRALFIQRIAAKN